MDGSYHPRAHGRPRCKPPTDATLEALRLSAAALHTDLHLAHWQLSAGAGRHGGGALNVALFVPDDLHLTGLRDQHVVRRLGDLQPVVGAEPSEGIADVNRDSDDRIRRRQDLEGQFLIVRPSKADKTDGPTDRRTD